MSATSSASLSTASAATTPGPGSTPGKEPRRRVDPSDLSRTFLACGLCGELFQEPKLLPCFHSFCRRCLAGYVPDHSLSLACPTCRQHSILPVAGVSALSDNRFVRRLLERIERIGARRLENGHAAKEEGDKEGVGGVGGGASPADLSSLTPKTRDEEDGEDGEEEEFEVTNDTNYDATSGAQDRSAFDSTADDLSADLDNSSSEVFDDHVTGGGGRAGVDGHVTCPAVSALCLRHESSELSRYCVECDTAVCTECLEAEHRKHSVMDLEEFSSSERSSLEKILNNVRDSTKSIDTSLRNIVKTKLKLERQKIEAEECVERSFNAIRESLERKREALLADIESESAAKLKRLDDQEREVTRLKRTIEACSSFVRSCLDGEANLVGMILAKKELSDKLELFCRSNVQLLPEENPFISFNQGKLSALCGLIEESARQSKSPTPVHGTPPANVKKLKTGEARRPAKAERVQKARKPPGVKAQRISSKAGDSADSEASSESSVGASVSVGPQDFGSVVCNSAVPYETTASGEHLRRCFVNVPALVTVTTKNSRGLNVARGGAKLSAKIYALEVGYKGKSEGRGSQGQEATSEAGAASSCETVPDESVAGGGGGGGGKGEEGERVGEAAKDQRVSFQQNCLREDPGADRREDIVTVTKVDEAKEKSVHKRTLVVPEVIDLGDGTYELTFTVTESALKRRPHGNHSTLDVSKTTTSADSGRLTPQSPSVTPCHRELHSSLDKLQQQKKRPKSAPEVLDLLDSVQLEVKLYGQPIKGSPFGLKVRREVAKFPKDQRTPAASSSSYLNSRHSDHSRRHSGTAGIKRAANLTSKPLGSGGNRKPSSASASQNDGPCQRIGVKGHNKGEFMNLQGIAIHEDRIYVADSNGQCVQVFSMEGKCILKFGAKGRSPGQLQRPTGVTCTPDGQHILVSDYENKWVGVYTIEGRFVNRLGQGKLAGPKGVSVDRQGRVVVVDNRSSTVWLYTMSGKIIGKFGARGVCASSGSSSPSASSPSGFITSAEAQARLAGPHFCSVDPEDGDVVVTDFHNHKVKVFSSDGQFKFSFGSAGDGNGQFNAPTGVCVDRQGNILVADWGNSRIQIFDKYGSFLSHIDTSSDPLYGPQGLAISPDNSVVVADSGNHCLKVYKHLFA